jgi:hypothetical protein
MSDEQHSEYSEQPLWLFFYDLQSENSEHLKPAEQDWLRSERVEIWYKLRYTYKCVPLNHSVWLVRGENTQNVLRKLKEEWVAEYNRHNFTANIFLFPVQTTAEGHQSFKVMEFQFILEWLGKIEKVLIRATEVGKIGKKNVQAHTKKIQLLANILNEDFDDSFPNWKLAQDSLCVVQDLLHRVQVVTGANIIMPH